MENKIDFTYEYSDLNLFHTRVQILTGKYAGIILEFGGSILAQIGDENTFTFNYILYEVPDQFFGPTLYSNKEFNNFAAYLLVDVINARNNDPEEKSKLEEAASRRGVKPNKIKIDKHWYVDAKKDLSNFSQQPIVKGLKGF
jgi:hypothetical protein